MDPAIEAVIKRKEELEKLEKEREKEREMRLQIESERRQRIERIEAKRLSSAQTPNAKHREIGGKTPRRPTGQI